ncbi:FAD-binding oxidoreductase [Salipiger mangrovisoli]|uniref:FAD-binding oxidoreductase n=1 Tax=Salipiger mangrovisoli TaxID=2865933 RepID=A0ABR9X5E2_9RHOB|nr:FAD-binding oxidoreductase [Salipiger mangrovisoli]MBE9638666.1 FAD-binding oxidoreductase [Salipiger mangrovisoli]
MTRRALLLGGGAMVGYLVGRSWSPEVSQLDGVARLGAASGAQQTAVLNDASELSATPIHSHVRPRAQGEALVKQFRAELAAARAEGRPVSVGAARHSMGGQAIPRNGRAITVDNAWIEPDTANGTYRVNGGARWSEVIAALDPIGFSPAVMQSNHDFGVAATFSVNAHGWPVPYGPMGATVRSLRMVLADGTLVTASRQENAELFALAMGGYGLIGLIVDLELEMVPNQRLVPEVARMVAEAFPAAFLAAVQDPAYPMAYGRLNVDRSGFFEEALLVRYRPTEDQSRIPPATGSGRMARLAARVYRAQVGREGVKRARWWMEADLAPRLGGESTRNSLMNEPVATLADGDPTRVDILHEYFVPPAAFGGFLAACRDVIPDAFVEFLNVTLRFVDRDPVSVLAHSPTPRIAAVMSFSQEMTARAEADHRRMTRALIDRILALGGSYYLPYRPHARADQFTAAYPRAAEFAARKRAIDPGLVLRNNLWDTYLEPL